MDLHQTPAEANPRQDLAGYEPPALLDAGDFAEQTRGFFGEWPDMPVGMWL